MAAICPLVVWANTAGLQRALRQVIAAGNAVTGAAEDAKN